MEIWDIGIWRYMGKVTKYKNCLSGIYMLLWSCFVTTSIIKHAIQIKWNWIQYTQTTSACSFQFSCADLLNAVTWINSQDIFTPPPRARALLLTWGKKQHTVVHGITKTIGNTFSSKSLKYPDLWRKSLLKEKWGCNFIPDLQVVTWLPDPSL